MHKTDATFELIRSMTANEKRFFRLQSGEGKNYLHVFDALDALKEYDNAALQKKLKGKKLNVSYEKNYLHGQLLRSLRLFHSDISPSAISGTFLHEAEILSGRMLFRQADTVIEKGIRFAGEHELYLQELLFRVLQYKNALRTGNYALLEQMDENIATDKRLFELAQNSLEYRAIQQKIYAIAATRAIAGEKKYRAELSRLRKHPLLQNEKTALSFLAKTYYYEILIYYHFLVGEYGKALQLCNTALALFESAPEKISTWPQSYFALLNSACNRCLNLGQPEKIEQYIPGMEKILSLRSKNLTDHLRADIKWMTYEKRVVAWTDLKRYRDVAKLGDEYGEFISRHSRTLRKEYLILHHVYSAIALYHTGEHKEALRHLNKLFDLEKHHVRTDYIITGYFVFFCIHYERKNPAIVTRFLHRLEKLIEKQAPDLLIPKIVVDYFTVLTQSEKRSEKIRAGKEALSKLEKIKNAQEHMLLTYFDISTWIKEMS